MGTDVDTTPVRESERLDWRRIDGWLRDRLPDCGIAGLDVSRPMDVEQFPGGHSNLTYRIRFGATELVLRRPPLGPVAPTAHDMSREYRWLSALHPVFPLAPRAYLLCEDREIAGAAFYVMERRRGLVVRDTEPALLRDRPDRRALASGLLVETLASLHRLDVARSDLGHLGKPAGFVARQVRGWTDRWQRAKTTDVDEMDALARWLGANLPPDPDRPAVVHGDFKLDNVLFDPALARVVAVLDWEMTALGHPLVDLGILLAYWVSSAPPDQRDALTTVTGRPGWSTRAALVEHYARATGHDLSLLPYFEIFALFKIAVVIQQIFHRYVHGQTDDPRFARFGDRVTQLAARAISLIPEA